MRASVIGIIILIIIALGAAFYWNTTSSTDTNTPSNTADETAVRNVVTAFGQQLQKVSLLAPDASTTIGSAYAAYVTPDLLAAWETDPQSAPGRMTSSPWPDHIDITSIMQTAEGYEVQGNLVLMTSNEVEHGGNAGTESVTLQLVNSNGQWLISGYQSVPSGNPVASPPTPTQ